MARLYCRYGKLVRYSELPSWFKKSHSDNFTIANEENSGKATLEFYTQILKKLTITNIKGKYAATLYPLRSVELYILSYKGKHKVFDNNPKLYKYLCKIGAIPEDDQLKELFKSYKILDLEKIAEIVPNAEIESLPLKLHYVQEEDISAKKFGRKDKEIQVWITPTLFEALAYIEVFAPRKAITDNIKKELKEKHFEEYKDVAFVTPAAVFTEVTERLASDSDI